MNRYTPGLRAGAIPDTEDSVMKTLNAIHNSWLMRRFGAVAFAFFLLKGVLWVLAPLIFVWFA